jgi:hypothetical protein
LKWIVKHRIRLAITCTKCNIIEHVDGSQIMLDHGLSCEKKYVEEEKEEEGETTAEGTPLKINFPNH